MEIQLLPLMGADLRQKKPASQTRLLSRMALFDVAWASVSPPLAFFIRDSAINRIDDVAIYTGVALIASMIAFQWFKLSSPILDYFSVHDALRVVQACLTTVALTAVVLFTFTRLDSAPRAVP